jgi:hypothetical protein
MEALRKLALTQFETQKGELPNEKVEKLIFVEVPLLPPSLLASCIGLRSLRLCCLRPTLSGELELPSLPNLKSLNVSDNQLTGFSPKMSLPALTKLWASNNKISSVDGLKVLGSICPALEILDLESNGLPSGYRKRVFEFVPSLKVVTEKDRDGNEVDVDENSDDDGDDDDEEEEGEEEEDFEGDEEEEDEAEEEDDEDDEFHDDMDDALKPVIDVGGDEKKGSEESADEDAPAAKKARKE